MERRCASCRSSSRSPCSPPHPPPVSACTRRGNRSPTTRHPQRPRPQDQDRAEPPYHKPFFAAAGLGLLGFGAGAIAGHAIQGDCSGEYCEFTGLFYGAAAGGGLGLALGAHLGNHHRGSLLLDVAVSGAVWGAGYAAMSSVAENGKGDALAFLAIALPVTQLLTTVAVERSRGRAKYPVSP